MRSILVIVAFIQLHQYAISEPMNVVHKVVSHFPAKLKVPPGVYELRRVMDGELGSIKSDQIVIVEQDQSLLKAQNEYQPLKAQQEDPERYGHTLEGATSISLSAAGDGQAYTQIQRGYQSEVVSAPDQDDRHNYIEAQREYQTHVANQNSGSSVVSVPDSVISREDYIQAQRGHQPLGMPQEIPQNYQSSNENSQSSLVSISAPGRQHYIQSPLQGAQQDLRNYQVVNENPEPRTVSISLPGYETAENSQNYMHALRQQQQIPEGYQVVNEGPAAHVVTMPGPGDTSSAYYTHQKPENYPVGNENAEYLGADIGQHYIQPQNEVNTPYESSYIPQNHMQKPIHAPTQIPLSFVGGTEGIQQQMGMNVNGPFWDMIRNSRTIPNSSPTRSYDKQPERPENYSRSN